MTCCIVDRPKSLQWSIILRDGPQKEFPTLGVVGPGFGPW